MTNSLSPSGGVTFLELSLLVGDNFPERAPINVILFDDRESSKIGAIPAEKPAPDFSSSYIDRTLLDP